MVSLSGKTGEVPTPLTKLYIKPSDIFDFPGGWTVGTITDTFWITQTSHYATGPEHCTLLLSESADVKTAQLDLIYTRGHWVSGGAVA